MFRAARSTGDGIDIGWMCDREELAGGGEIRWRNEANGGGGEDRQTIESESADRKTIARRMRRAQMRAEGLVAFTLEREDVLVVAGQASVGGFMGLPAEIEASDSADWAFEVRTQIRG